MGSNRRARAIREAETGVGSGSPALGGGIGVGSVGLGVGRIVDIACGSSHALAVSRYEVFEGAAALVLDTR